MKTFPHLLWYEWLWGALPLLLAIPGGWLGFAFGVAGFAMNVYRFASPDPRPLKWMATTLITISATILYMVVATVIDMISIG